MHRLFKGLFYENRKSVPHIHDCILRRIYYIYFTFAALPDTFHFQPHGRHNVSCFSRTFDNRWNAREVCAERCYTFSRRCFRDLLPVYRGTAWSYIKSGTAIVLDSRRTCLDVDYIADISSTAVTHHADFVFLFGLSPCCRIKSKKPYECVMLFENRAHRGRFFCVAKRWIAKGGSLSGVLMSNI